MEKNYIEEKSFDNTDFTKNALPKGEYEACTFSNCNFSNSDLSGSHFSECAFYGCNLSLVKLAGTGFQDTKFKDCKLLGLKFEDCDAFLFAVNIENCVLNLSSFYKMKLKKTLFKKSTMHEVDFTESDLTNSTFDNCDLLRSIFELTILEKADLRTSYNYSINPEVNKLKKARFSLHGVIGLLDKYDIEIEGM